jgi:hypothetical protein
MAIDKSTWNKKVKVSQSTIDDIKGLGMTKALRLAKMNAKGPQEGLVKEYQEATRRLYGDRRFAAATGGSAVKKPSTSYSPTPYKAPKASTSYSPKPMSAATKASIKKSASVKARANAKGGMSKNVAAGIGAAAAVGLTIASRGRLTGMATKLSPGLMKNKYAQSLLLGKVAPKVTTKASTAVMKAKDAALSASGRVSAKTTKSVTQSQYDAMSAAARAKGVTTVAKKAAAKKAAAKKTAAKKTAAKKSGLSAGRRWDANAPK